MMNNGNLPKYYNGRSNIPDDFLRGVVKFIIRCDNVQLLSWGIWRLRYDGKWMCFPKLVRKLSAEKIWEKFFEDLKNENPDVEGAIWTGQTTVAEQQRRKREIIER